MRLNQRQLEIFNAIMINKSMIAAAAALGTSQPTISRELRDMEQRIGFELFLRFGKRLTPTNQALLLHEVVRRAFVGMEEIGRAASAIRMHNAANCRVATIPAYAEAIIPRVAQRLLKLRPAVHLSLHSLEELSLQHEMATTVFDLGVTEGRFEYQGVVSQRINVGDLVCVLPVGHSLSAKRILEPTDFEDAPFVYFSQDDPYRRKLDDIFFAAGVSRSYAVETTTAASVCSMVSAGVGVSIINPLTAANYVGKGVVLRRFSVGVPYSLAVWRPTRKAGSTAAEKFTSVLKEVALEMRATLLSAMEEAPHFPPLPLPARPRQ
ncbi:LysR family transcriptional regulator [Ensifer adhaerens]|uniref:LysR family transcriptional regulator n=1 Tax=Ensifer adhaerens TaxID=106592 RepID=UPI001CBBD32B|nr:LysR family transcriptional regulator [Ensifer adhaerens]MBZ7926539.1 LysR family transcriptional regulator [Ensifer adhaerens]UAX97121.1 LysR family transcriptional regulator [Ensifer adhaerens]